MMVKLLLLMVVMVVVTIIFTILAIEALASRCARTICLETFAVLLLALTFLTFAYFGSRVILCRLLNLAEGHLSLIVVLVVETLVRCALTIFIAHLLVLKTFTVLLYALRLFAIASDARLFLLLL